MPPSIDLTDDTGLDEAATLDPVDGATDGVEVIGSGEGEPIGDDVEEGASILIGF